ncbi:hypothetical protein A1O3_01715 [Capronia epimyces CBS 606.96]|uniref:Uncharacterized protein n=1 Tax=Capronia epimyces CBS 606.96 TaxID=1182542 RepID=W9YKR3_9EURO|nr:uncharacterized protein A1O3_01715 [Capronia epimyces CBS 606.96]EXJ93158.1 hypothetical protein A1O3_01715 [Capronia epimyces CBS 606.96]
MPVSTRRSTIGATTVADNSAEAVTAILNNVAGSKMSNSGRKRKRQSEVHDALATTPTPSKRATVEIPTTAVPTTTRQSGRLKARTSLAAPPLPPRGDPFLFPAADEDGDEAESEQGTRAEPVKKSRRLKQPKQPEESPFKGRGVLETRSTARVNLDDSPAHQPARHALRKVAKSLQRSRRPPAREESTRPRTRTTDDVPFQGEDILDVVHRQGRSTSPVADPGPNLPAPVPAPAARKTANGSRDRPPLTRITRRRETDDREATARRRALQKEQSKARNPSAQEIDRSRNEESPSETFVTNQGEVEEPWPHDSSGMIDEAPADFVSASQRPEAEAERRRREQAEAEEEAKQQQRIKDALRGIEAAIEVQGCKDAWQDALVGRARLLEASSHEPTSTLGKAAARALKTLTTEYRKLARSPPPTPQESAQVLQENYRVLKERCKHIQAYRNRPDLVYDRERVRMVRDVYGRLIPDSLKLDKAALKTLFQDNQLSLAAYEEIYQLLQITNLLVETANEWQPRPSLDHQGKSIVKNDIGPSITEIMERYQDAIADQERIKYVDELEARQKMDLKKTLAVHQQKMAEKLARYRKHMQTIATVPALLQPSSQLVVDIDDLDVDDQPAVDGDRNGATGAHRDHGTFAQRPRRRREPTEEIPAPGPIQWEQNEIKLLVKGLQTYRTASRFEDIVYVYGGPGGGLEKYDMDQIMAQAKWLKRSMAKRLRDEKHDRDWDWLRSVPE